MTLQDMIVEHLDGVIENQQAMAVLDGTEPLFTERREAARELLELVEHDLLGIVCLDNMLPIEVLPAGQETVRAVLEDIARGET
jgi:hypothetical protein